MTSLLIGEQEESLFLLHEQPPTILQQAESLDGIKSIQHLLSASSSLASTTLPNRTQQSFRPSTASHEVIPPPLRFSTNQSRYSNSSDVDSFVRQFEQRLDEHRHQLQKEYDRKIQQMIESKNHEVDALRNRYENKLHELEETNRQLEIQSGQTNEENKRLKIELEHQKQQYRIELTSLQQHSKGSESDAERKLHELKVLHENEKQEMKRSHSRTYQDLLDETNQRLKKMESEHKYQQTSHESSIEEMEKRMVDLRSNIEHLQQVKQKLDDDKIHLIKTNEKLQLQIQDLTNKQRYLDREHADKSQRYENELKSVRVRCQSSVDLLEKENELIKSRSAKTIDELEKKLTTITEKFHELERFFERKTREQEENYHKNFKQCELDHEKQIQRLNDEHREQLNNELQRQKAQMQLSLENQMQEMNDQTRENERQLIEKVKMEYEQLLQQNEQLLRDNFNKELEESKRRYEQTISKKDEKTKNDLERINKLSMELKVKHENEKQEIINEYDEYIRKLEKQSAQKADEYEQRIESVISKTNEQLKSIEDEYQIRHAKQESIINEQEKLLAKLEDEKHHTNLLHDKQTKILSEQHLRERNDMKSQSELYMKKFEKNFNLLKLKHDQLERKIAQLTEQHKHELLECRLSYDNKMKDLLSNDVRLDLENTIYSLKQQVVFLQQRISFLQQELQQYIQQYGHRPAARSSKNANP
ncbi:unnamed protein product [Adineta ricciae]|uniref:Uncharacterized protein n=1 Tax=Adineta ricciae TaxID=249248 RepID=A0A815QQF4_ADIRI|nr:unnamed protein product [Adineta ricciae]CAF1465577.1 unnamed protein product [Adineta ricciae]